jgi:diadenosine tetraphosphate (Ap4A) HIT family hydrolase
MVSPLLEKDRWVNENKSAAALRDRYPVSPGHTLIVPKREVSSIFELSEEEMLDCWRLLKAERDALQLSLGPEGFNVGINVGEAAGQTIAHPHIHLIPRFKGDVPFPRGGVRAVIPSKASY